MRATFSEIILKISRTQACLVDDSLDAVFIFLEIAVNHRKVLTRLSFHDLQSLLRELWCLMLRWFIPYQYIQGLWNGKLLLVQTTFIVCDIIKEPLIGIGMSKLFRVVE